MAEMLNRIDDLAKVIHRHRGLALPVGAVMLALVIFVPLPPMLMDLLLAGNIALSAVILLTTIYASGPLEFSVFPSVLLGATLLRLVLNVATTRLILTSGADGRGLEEAQLAAGQVLWSFSQFVASGSLAVGVIIFIIIVIIQFMVVTKGATRMSEVAARFILDAMPGKQMGVDAELSAGLINEEQARRRRRQIEAEADFYGAMDGASKFLRGDAVAAIVILVVNIFGGLYVGLVQYGWPLSETVDLFTRLTIGDGLVTQIPAFIVSVAAAMMVSRGTARGNLGETMLSQVFSRPVVLVITAAFLAMLGFTSLPKGPLLLMGVGCGGLAWVLSRREQDAPPPSSEGSEGKPAAVAPAGTGQNVNELLLIDAMRLELGFALVSLTDASADGGLLRRIATMRKQIASEMGLIVPPIHIRDNLDLEARGYAIFIRGSKVASGRLYPNQLLAVGGDEESVQLMGRPTNEPIFGASAMWINQSQRGQAEAAGYTVVSGGEALMTHLNEVVKRHAPELLSRQRVVRLLENLKASEANLVQEVTSKLTYAQIQKVLQNLLSERVSIRNMETILEALCDSASRSTQVEALTEDVRAAMAGSMCQALCDANGKLPCVGLRPELEEELGAYVSEEPRWSAASIPPELARKVALVVSGELARLQRQGRPPVVICSPPLRPALSKLLKPSLPEAVVLGYNEIDSVEVESVATVGI